MWVVFWIDVKCMFIGEKSRRILPPLIYWLGVKKEGNQTGTWAGDRGQSHCSQFIPTCLTSKEAPLSCLIGEARPKHDGCLGQMLGHVKNPEEHGERAEDWMGLEGSRGHEQEGKVARALLEPLFRDGGQGVCLEPLGLEIWNALKSCGCGEEQIREIWLFPECEKKDLVPLHIGEKRMGESAESCFRKSQ